MRYKIMYWLGMRLPARAWMWLPLRAREWWAGEWVRRNRVDYWEQRTRDL